jgi:hypothetical protein
MHTPHNRREFSRTRGSGVGEPPAFEGGEGDRRVGSGQFKISDGYGFLAAECCVRASIYKHTHTHTHTMLHRHLIRVTADTRALHHTLMRGYPSQHFSLRPHRRSAEEYLPSKRGRVSSRTSRRCTADRNRPRKRQQEGDSHATKR